MNAGVIILRSKLKTGRLDKLDVVSTLLSPKDYVSILQELKSTSISNLLLDFGSIELNEKIWELWGLLSCISPPILP